MNAFECDYCGVILFMKFIDLTNDPCKDCNKGTFKFYPMNIEEIHNNLKKGIWRIKQREK